MWWRGEGEGGGEGVRISRMYRTAITCRWIVRLTMIGGRAMRSSCSKRKSIPDQAIVQSMNGPGLHLAYTNLDTSLIRT